MANDQERREKARRIAEAYSKLQLMPGSLTEGQRASWMLEIQHRAYDKLCWMEAMDEVEQTS